MKRGGKRRRAVLPTATVSPTMAEQLPLRTDVAVYTVAPDPFEFISRGCKSAISIIIIRHQEDNQILIHYKALRSEEWNENDVNTGKQNNHFNVNHRTKTAKRFIKNQVFKRACEWLFKMMLNLQNKETCFPICSALGSLCKAVCAPGLNMHEAHTFSSRVPLLWPSL